MKFQFSALVVITLQNFFIVGEGHCVGTCYSGRLFPETKDIFHGKHLKGYSYSNITTDDPVKCYRHCVHDCRCKACQMKDARCELLDQDKTSEANDFKDESGYVYFDLQQTMYQGKSHMVPPGVCYNGCCRSQPCMNGGTCVEHCTNPKMKFSCTCPLGYFGSVCDKEGITSCLDVMRSTPKRVNATNGKYNINVEYSSGKYKNHLIYCAFEFSNRAWTLIESFSISNMAAYRSIAFHDAKAERNQVNPNWDDYRQGLAAIQHIRSKSTMFRVTCDFTYRSSLVPDYLFGYLSDYDITGRGNVTGECFKFAHINIRGKDFFNKTASVWQESEIYHFHIDGCWGCGLAGLTNCTSGEDNFGYYKPVIPTTECTKRENSTTQFWLGAEL